MKAFTHQHVEDLKGMINQLIGIPIEQQTLTQSVFSLSNDKTLKECAFKDLEELTLRYKRAKSTKGVPKEELLFFKVKNRITGKELHLDFKNDEDMTINDLRQIIAQEHNVEESDKVALIQLKKSEVIGLKKNDLLVKDIIKNKLSLGNKDKASLICEYIAYSYYDILELLQWNGYFKQNI
jgi:hypothetical protein